MVIAQEMTATAREILDSARIGSIDGLGNVHLALPGLIMKITGAKRRPLRAASARLSGKSGVVAEAMLLDVGESWSVADLAGRCRVSPGLVHRVMLRLDHERVVTASGAGPTRRAACRTRPHCWTCGLRSSATPLRDRRRRCRPTRPMS